eukprot:COSAG01_NODE_1820_length_9152_cov_22.869215_6_plen_198_part_00
MPPILGFPASARSTRTRRRQQAALPGWPLRTARKKVGVNTPTGPWRPGQPFRIDENGRSQPLIVNPDSQPRRFTILVGCTAVAVAFPGQATSCSPVSTSTQHNLKSQEVEELPSKEWIVDLSGPQPAAAMAGALGPGTASAHASASARQDPLAVALAAEAPAPPALWRHPAPSLSAAHSPPCRRPRAQLRPTAAYPA